MEIYSTWEILLAWLPSSDGTAANHRHPCIYLGENPKAPGEIIVVGITHDLSYRENGFSFDMPWAAGKHSETGLDLPSIAQARWRPSIKLGCVTKPMGFTPLAQKLLISECLQHISIENKASRANPS